VYSMRLGLPNGAIRSMFDNTVSLGAVLTFLAVICGFVAQWLREGRARKWAVKDASDLAVKVAEDAEKIAVKVSEAKVNAIMDALNVQAADRKKSYDELHCSIGEGTASAGKAYTEANMFNKKLETLNNRLSELSEYIHNRPAREAKRRRNEP
jgi:hypothetical protein